MPKLFRVPIHRFLLASTALGAAGVAACSWNVGFLDSTAGSQPDAAQKTDTLADASDATASDGSVEIGAPLFGDGGDLVVNPSCENGVTDWSTLGGTPLESSARYVHAGDTASCHAYDRVHEETAGELPSYDGPMQDITEAVVPGHQYSVSAWVLWAPPVSDAGSGSELDAADGSREAGADAATDVDADFESQDADVSVKVTCGSSISYTRLASTLDVPETTWTQINGATPLLTVPTGCEPLDLELYVEGPDIGLDLYVGGVTLLFVD